MALRFDLRQLRYFVAIAESGSFRAAAERLHVSQPPLSRQLAGLENALGARLLERGPAGVTLTAAGRVALARAEAVLREAERMASEVSRHSAAQAPIRIAVTPAVSVADRARVARAWGRAFRGQEMEIDVGYSRDVIPGLKRGHLDFALVGLPGDAAGLETREVCASPLLAALPSRHPLARRKRVSMLEVTDLPLFWIPRSLNPPYHDSCMRYFRNAGFRPRMIVVDPGLTQTLERVATGEGWTMDNGSTPETRVRGVAFRTLAEGDDLAVRVVAAWRGADRDGRFERLAAIAAATLSPSRR